jgi:hypothetical protein
MRVTAVDPEKGTVTLHDGVEEIEFKPPCEEPDWSRLEVGMVVESWGPIGPRWGLVKIYKAGSMH